jgi:4-hydroxybenzoate polyprenyltransferase
MVEGQPEHALDGRPPPAAPAALRYAKLFSSLVKLEHTVFALPFAYVGAFLALDAVPTAGQLVWITLAMVGARSLAMALNRLIDAGIDARNPRTAGRELPRGALKPWQVVLFAVASLGLFLVAVFQLAPIVHWLWPIPVVGFVVYPYLKRATWLCHLWLGAVDGLAPVGAWAAVTNELPWQAWLLGAAVAVWIAGFDVLYALFDLDVDREQGLHSFPARFGIPATFTAARCLHAATVALLAGAGLGLPVGALYWLGVAFVGCLLVYEHALVSPRDWRRLDTAFFTMNGVISIGFFVFVLADVLT